MRLRINLRGREPSEKDLTTDFRSALLKGGFSPEESAQAHRHSSWNWRRATYEWCMKSRAGRLAWQYCAYLFAALFTMPVAALLSMETARLCLHSAGRVAAVAPCVAALIAGAMTVSPRLRDALSSLASLTWSSAVLMMAMVGVATVTLSYYFDDPSFESWTALTAALAYFQSHTPAILFQCFVFSFVMLVLSRVMSGQSELLFSRQHDRQSTARHEAAHALVACVLGFSVRGGRVLQRPGPNGLVGYIEVPPPTDSAADAIHALIVRKMAVFVAGVVGSQRSPSFLSVCRSLIGQPDGIEARTLSWIGAAGRQDSTLLIDVVAAVILDLNTPAWRLAIDGVGGEMLLRYGDLLEGERIAEVARVLGLRMDAVQAVARAAPGSVTDLLGWRPAEGQDCHA